jgi:ketosteroid isomerase-like protein
MKTVNRLAAALLLLGLAPSAKTETTAVESNAEKEVMEIEEKMTAAYLSRNAEVFVQYLDPELTAFHASNPYRIDSREVFQDAMGIFFKNASPKGLYKFQPRVQVNGETAIVTYHFLETGGEGPKAYSYNGKETDVFVKKQGKWLMVHFHSSRVVQPH